MMIVTFGCQRDVYVYTAESKVKPRLPYKTHDSIEAAKLHLNARGIKRIKVEYQ